MHTCSMLETCLLSCCCRGWTETWWSLICNDFPYQLQGQSMPEMEQLNLKTLKSAHVGLCTASKQPLHWQDLTEHLTILAVLHKKRIDKKNNIEQSTPPRKCQSKCNHSQLPSLCDEQQVNAHKANTNSIKLFLSVPDPYRHTYRETTKVH